MRKALSVVAITSLVCLSVPARGAILLGTAKNFAVLAGSAITNTGFTVIDGGDVGVSPGTAITGFPPGLVLAPDTIQSATADASQAQNDLTVAYTTAATLPRTATLTGVDLGGLTLAPGVYFFATSAQLTGQLTLDYGGDPLAEFVFQIGSTLTTASASSVISIRSGGSNGCNVFWQVGSSATLGTGTAFEGHILALASITLNTGASVVEGSLLARTGAVTLDDNHLVNCTDAVPAPGAATLALLGGLLLTRRRRTPRA